jgi:hypothetical protein
MKSLQIILGLVDGSAIYFADEARSGRELVQALFGHEIRPPAERLQIRATGKDGTTVVVFVAVDERDEAHVRIEHDEQGK